MPTYIRLIKVHDAQKMLDDPAWGPDQASKIIAEFGAKIINVWATLGPYDFVGLVEAPDDEAMMAAAAKVGASLGIEAVTMPAVASSEFLQRVRS